MEEHICKCQGRRKIRVMDYEPTEGTCLTCYGKVDLTPDPDAPAFLPRDAAAEKFDYKIPVHRNNKKVCTGCRKTYQPIMANDGDCCPSCSRY